jgi:RES domain-containing protein
VRLWRISQRKFALDKSCAGAARFGGRWNPIGVPALYCGTSIALCSLEKFVHIGSAPLPPLVLVAIDIPDDSMLDTPAIRDLPAGWDTMPTSAAAQKFGGTWLAEGRNLGLIVPSAIVPEETNVVLNPQHPDYAEVRLAIVRPFSFDDRMFT